MITEPCCVGTPAFAHSCFPKYIGIVDGDVYRICLTFQFSGRYTAVCRAWGEDSSWLELCWLPFTHQTRETGVWPVCLLS